jgi:hypothetical protein
MLIVDTVQDSVAHIVHRNRLSENDLANIKETRSNPQGAFRSVVGGTNSPAVGRVGDPDAVANGPGTAVPEYRVNFGKAAISDRRSTGST